MGWRGDELFIEVHAPMEGQDRAQTHSPTNITRLLVAATQDKNVPIDWAKAELAFAHSSGVPVPVMLGPSSGQIIESAARTF
jgi:hypothetical protein